MKPILEMTRKEEIEEAAMTFGTKCHGLTPEQMFIKGADWADRTLIFKNETFESIIFTAIGEASMCWSELPTGVFESSRARRIGYMLIQEIAKILKVSPG